MKHDIDAAACCLAGTRIVEIGLDKLHPLKADEVFSLTGGKVAIPRTLSPRSSSAAAIERPIIQTRQ